MVGKRDGKKVISDISSEDLRKAEEELKRNLRKFILECPHASERIVVANWQYVTSRYRDDFDLLRESLKTFFHKNPHAYRIDVSKAYIETEENIYKTKGRR